MELTLKTDGKTSSGLACSAPTCTALAAWLVSWRATAVSGQTHELTTETGEATACDVHLGASCRSAVERSGSSWRVEPIGGREERELVERATCPARLTTWGPWERGEMLDGWERRGADVCCSFCGSMRPAEFLAWLQVAADMNTPDRVECGKPGKFYLVRPGVPNAMSGAIKFYTYHLDSEGMASACDLIGRALSASDDKRIRSEES